MTCRPPVRWSTVLSRRAKWYGCSYDVDMVQPNPKLSVAAAMAGTRDKGSLTGH